MKNLKTSFAVVPFTFDNGAVPQEINIMHNGEHTPLNDAYNYAYRNSVFNLYAGNISGEEDLNNNFWHDRRIGCSTDILRNTLDNHIDYLILDTINRMELTKYHPNIDIPRLNSKATRMRYCEAFDEAMYAISDRYRDSDMHSVEKKAFNLSHGESFLEAVEVILTSKLFILLMEEGLSSQDATNTSNTFRTVIHPGLVTMFNNVVSVYNPIITGFTISLEEGK